MEHSITTVIRVMNETNTPVKLNLGCGSRRIKGYIGIDISQDAQAVDFLLDCSNLSAIQDDTVDVLYASHVLEHFGRNEQQKVLTEWVRVLKPGGIMRLSVPDFSAIVEHYQHSGLSDLVGLLYGGQDSFQNYHHMCYDYFTLGVAMTNVGLRNVEKWDWRTTEHMAVDDYSQAYLPHMDKAHGRHMSLNMQGIA